MAEISPELKWNRPVSAIFTKQAATPSKSELSIDVRQNQAIVQVFAKKGKIEQVASKLKIGFEPGQSTTTKEFVAIPISPGQWILVAQDGADGSFGHFISRRLDGIGHVSEQSHSRVCFRTSGYRARDFMQRGCRLDLHESVAGTGFCAQTQMAQIGVLVHQIDDQPTYDLYVYSGYAVDFANWMTHTGMKYGVKFTADE